MVSTGIARITFTTDMDNLNYAVSVTGDLTGTRANTHGFVVDKALTHVDVKFQDDASSNVNVVDGNVIIVGGRS